MYFSMNALEHFNNNFRIYQIYLR